LGFFQRNVFESNRGHLLGHDVFLPHKCVRDVMGFERLIPQ
jgi:hypothetical protein